MKRIGRYVVHIFRKLLCLVLSHHANLETSGRAYGTAVYHFSRCSCIDGHVFWTGHRRLSIKRLPIVSNNLLIADFWLPPPPPSSKFQSLNVAKQGKFADYRCFCLFHYYRKINVQTDRETDRQTDRQTDRKTLTDTQAGGQAGRQTDRQADRIANGKANWEMCRK